MKLTKKSAYEQYWTRMKNTTECAEYFNVSVATFTRFLHKNGIKARVRGRNECTEKRKASIPGARVEYINGKRYLDIVDLLFD